jgi:hypothetical protein
LKLYRRLARALAIFLKRTTGNNLQEAILLAVGLRVFLNPLIQDSGIGCALPSKLRFENHEKLHFAILQNNPLQP